MIRKSKQILIDKIKKLDSQSMDETVGEGTAHSVSDVGHSIMCWSLKYIPNKVLKKWIKQFEQEMEKK